ncbi:hypothetical protein BHM03_00042647 [Ensete ventricosum]|nr:hypothetical protein BHM03_00042647 [Ensete ventricosum]
MLLDTTTLFDYFAVSFVLQSKKPSEKTAAALLCVSSLGYCRIRGVRNRGFVIVSPRFLVMLAVFCVPPVDPYLAGRQGGTVVGSAGLLLDELGV